MNWTSIGQHCWSFGLAFGLFVASIVTLVITVWEWVENPGGIFYDGNSTQWSMLYDTAISWFVPTLLYAAIAATIGHLSITLLSQWIGKK